MKRCLADEIRCLANQANDQKSANASLVVGPKCVLQSYGTESSCGSEEVTEKEGGKPETTSRQKSVRI